MNLEKYSSDSVAMYEAVESSSIPGQQNEEAIGNPQENIKQTYNDFFKM